MTDALARKLFTELKERTGQIPDADLDEFWATLERPRRTGSARP